MTLPKKSVIFETLNKTQQPPRTSPQLDLFPELCDTNTTNTDYWYYSDLHNLFGKAYFPTEPDFHSHIWQKLVMPVGQKTKQSFPQLAPTNIDFYNQHITTIHHPYTLNGHTFKNTKDLKVSRYAAWCLCRQNPYLIFARTYFIAPAISPNLSFDELKGHSYQFARLYLRNELAKNEKAISAISLRYGGEYNLINTLTCNAMFEGYSIRSLKNTNRIPNKQHAPLSNYLGAATLNAKSIAIKKTIKRFDQSNTKNLDALCEIFYDELTKQRIKLKTEQNIIPLDDIYQTPITQVQSLLTRTERDFILKYANTHIR